MPRVRYRVPGGAVLAAGQTGEQVRAGVGVGCCGGGLGTNPCIGERTRCASVPAFC